MKGYGYLFLVASLAAFCSGASAHHSVSGQFDADKRVTVTGVIERIDWINPHTYFYLDVENDDGTTTTWQLESLPTAMLRKAGLTRDMIRDGGSEVTVDAIMARDGTANLAWLLRIDYPDGHFYQFSGSGN